MCRKPALFLGHKSKEHQKEKHEEKKLAKEVTEVKVNEETKKGI